jgi:hypothetical protein
MVACGSCISHEANAVSNAYRRFQSFMKMCFQQFSTAVSALPEMSDFS